MHWWLKQEAPTSISRSSSQYTDYVRSVIERKKKKRRKKKGLSLTLKEEYRKKVDEIKNA